MKADPARFVTGWLTVDIVGERPERLLDLALSQGIELREVQRLAPNVIRVQLAPAGLRQLRHLTRRARCRLRIRRRRGLPFLLEWLRRRPLLPLAALLFVPQLAYLCSIVAAVEVTSPEPLDPREQALVYELAKEAGVEAGRSRWGMDLEAAERDILLGFPRLIYTEILRHGNRLEIAVVRRIDVAEEERIRPAGDLVAAADGVIVDVLVQRGTAQVESGDAVRPGDVLISGDFHGDYVGARGIVTATVYGEGRGECPLSEVEAVPTGRVSQEVRLARAGASDRGTTLLKSGPAIDRGVRRQERRQLLLWRRFPLPVEVILIEVAEIDPVRRERSPEQARYTALALARKQALAGLLTACGGEPLGPITYADQVSGPEDGVVRARSVAQTLAEIGAFRPRDEQTGAADAPP